MPRKTRVLRVPRLKRAGPALYKRARTAVIEKQTASTKFLQKELGVSAEIAKRLLRRLDKDGVTENGGRTRRVLVSADVSPKLAEPAVERPRKTLARRAADVFTGTTGPRNAVSVNVSLEVKIETLEKLEGMLSPEIGGILNAIVKDLKGLDEFRKKNVDAAVKLASELAKFAGS